MRDGNFRSVSLCAQRVILLMLFSGLLNSCLAQSQPPSVLERIPTTNSTIETETQMNVQTMDQERPGNISGTIEDQSGAVRGGANVRLTREGESEHQEVLSGTNGEFSFDDVPPGRFHLEISSAGFITQKISGVLQPGQFCILPRILLAVSGGETEVRVALPPVEVAEEQIKEQEKQRVFGIIPNFYVTYDPDQFLSTRSKNSSWLGNRPLIRLPLSLPVLSQDFSRPLMITPVTVKACKVTQSGSGLRMLMFLQARSSAAPYFQRFSNRTRVISTKEPAVFDRGLVTRWPVLSFARETTSAGSRITRASSVASRLELSHIFITPQVIAVLACCSKPRSSGLQKVPS